MNAGIGHNKPPLAEELAAEMAEVIAPLRERSEQLLASAAKIKIIDEEDIGKIGDTAKMIKALSDKVIEGKGAILDPVYDAQSRVIAAASNFVDPLDEARRSLAQLIDDFRAEQKRLADEKKQKQLDFERELARQKNVQISEAPPAPVTPPPKRATPARGDYGGRVGQRKTITVSIEDFSLIPETILQSIKVKEAILSVARSMAQHQESIPGIKIERDLKTNFT